VQFAKLKLLARALERAQVFEGGRIVVSSNNGDSWEPASAGIDTPMPDMVELFVAAPDDTVWAVCSGGRLLRATPGEWFWRSAVPADATLAVEAVAFVRHDASRDSTGST